MPRMVSRVVPVVMNWPEVLHGRWAMLGTHWCQTSELLQKYSAIGNGASKIVWFKAGAPILTTLLVSTLVTLVGTPPVWPQTQPPSPHTVRPSRSTLVGLCRALWAA